MNARGPIVIVGFMGCGKTEAARELARRLNLTMVDLDREIAEQEGRTAAQIIVEDGEAAFRSIETKLLRELLQSVAAGVIALGGGAWISETNRALIDRHRGVSVWLDTPFEVCWRRIDAAEEDRPLGRDREQAEELYQRRLPVYRLAAIRVPVLSEESLEGVVTRVETELIANCQLPIAD